MFATLPLSLHSTPAGPFARIDDEGGIEVPLAVMVDINEGTTTTAVMAGSSVEVLAAYKYACTCSSFLESISWM